jgi:hypothetical protein
MIGESKMTIKKIFLLIILFTVTAVLFGDDWEFITEKKTMLYDCKKSSFNKSQDALFEIEKSIKIKLSERPFVFRKLTNNVEDMILGTFIYNNEEYYIDCADLVPLNTFDTFDLSFISDLNSNTRKTWVPAYYIAVLQSQDRDTILTFDKFWREFEPWIQGGGVIEWFDYFTPSEFSICNSVLVKDIHISMMIKDIKKTNNGYAVTVKFARKDWEKFKTDDLNWDSVKEKEFFDMILCIDGEYMDVYLDDMEHKLTTFALVNQIFLKELKSLVENNKKADLSKVHFPHRADGSTDDYLTSELSADTDVFFVKNKKPESAIKTENQQKAIVQNSDEEATLPLWAWFAIIGGAVVVVGGLVFIVKCRK